MGSERKPLLRAARQSAAAPRSDENSDRTRICKITFLQAVLSRNFGSQLVAGVLFAIILMFIALGATKILSPIWQIRSHDSSSENSSSPAQENIRFLSLNTFMRPVPVGVRDYEKQRLPRLVDAISSYTIACNQEIFWLSLCKHAFIKQLGSALPYFVSSPSIAFRDIVRWPPKLIDGGLLIVSRYPIVKSDFIVYSAFVAKSIDAVVAKGVLYALINLTSVENSSDIPQFVHVFTTHLQASMGFRGDPWRHVRELQLAQLVAFVELATNQSEYKEFPIIIAGDFNVDARSGKNDSRSSPEYRSMMQIMSKIPNLRDIIFEASTSGQPVTSAGGLSGSNQKNERLDYIFYAEPKSGTTSRLIVHPEISPRVNPFSFETESPAPPFRTLSDHYGVEAVFSLPRYK